MGRIGAACAPQPAPQAMASACFMPGPLAAVHAGIAVGVGSGHLRTAGDREQGRLLEIRGHLGVRHVEAVVEVPHPDEVLHRQQAAIGAPVPRLDAAAHGLSG